MSTRDAEPFFNPATEDTTLLSHPTRLNRVPQCEWHGRGNTLNIRSSQRSDVGLP